MAARDAPSIAGGPPVAVPDPEPYAGSRRSPGAARGVGYTLIGLAPLLWVVIVGGPSSRNDHPGALSGGHYALLLIGLMAWWALSVARRRETWKRRQIVRESAALSAGDGIPRVVDGTDPDPYPQAALRPRSEAVWGGIILLGPAVTALVAAFTGHSVLARQAIVFVPGGLLLGGWLLRIAQARSRYAARQEFRLRAAASGAVVPPDGDYVADPEPFAAIRMSAAALRRIQRVLVAAGAVLVLRTSVAVTSSPRGPDRATIINGAGALTVYGLAALLLLIVRRREEWVFRVRARAAILQAARTRERLVTVSLDPSWGAGTLTSPRSKLRGMALVPLAWVLLPLMSAVGAIPEEVMLAGVALSPLLLGSLVSTYFWERRRQHRAALAARAGVEIAPSNARWT